jgi:GAF domain-containing protein
MAENQKTFPEQTSPTTKPKLWNFLAPDWLRSGWGILGLAMGGYLLVFALWLVFKWGGEENLVLISDLAYLPMSLFAGFCAMMVARKADLLKRARWGWTFIGLAMLSTFLADVLWFYFEIISQQEPFPSLADPFYLAYYGLAFIGLILFPASASNREWRLKLVLDVAIVTVAAWLPIWYFLVAPTMADVESDLLTRLLAAAYPVADLVLLAGVFSLAFRRMERGQLVSLGLLFAAFSVTFVGDLIYGYAGLAGVYAAGQWVDITWIMGYFLVGLAALRAHYPEIQRPSPTFDRFYERLIKALPLVVSLLGYALVVALAVVGLRQGLPMTALVLTTMALTGLILGRQLVEVNENRRLARELQAAAEQRRKLDVHDEQSARARERDIRLVAGLAQTLSELTDLTDLLPKAVDLVQRQMALYYVQVYLYDSARRSLVLRAGSGAVGAELLRRGHRLPLSLASINGTAAIEQRPVIVDDVRQSDKFRPNPLLPETRSEAAIPLTVGDRLVGVLDLQSDQTQAFPDEVLPVLQALAGQLAVAIENAELFSQAQEARQQLERQMQAMTRQNWGAFLDAVHQSEAISFAYEEGALRPGDQGLDFDPQRVLQSPITISGEPLGVLVLESPQGRTWTTDEVELVNAVADRVARQIENLRLLAQAERYRLEAEETARRLTRQGWQEYQKDLQDQLSFVYDQTQVQVEASDSSASTEATIRQPLLVRETPIGALELEGDRSLSDEDLALIQTVAESLSAHIDSLRLTAQTQAALSNMETLNEVTRAASRTLELDLVLAEILDRILGVAEFGAGLISIEDTFTKRLSLAVHRNLPEAMVTKLTTLGLDGTPCDVVYRSGDTVILSDLERLPEDLRATNLEDDFVRQAMQRPLAMGFHSYFGLALSTKGRIIGTICLFDEGNKTISPAKLSMLEAIGQQVGILVENARLFQSTQKALSKTEVLYTAIAQMNQAESYKDILTALAEHTLLGRADRLLLMGVFDRPMGGGQMPEWIYPVAWRGNQPVQVSRRYPAELMSGAMDGMVNEVQIAIISGLASTSPMARGVLRLFDLDLPAASVSGVPLILGDRSIGFVIGVHSQEIGPVEDEIQQLKAIAGQAAIAVESRLLLEQAQAKARQEQQLRQVAASVFAASDVDSILRRAVEQVGRALGAQAYIYLGQGNGSNGQTPGGEAESANEASKEPAMEG